MVPDLRKKQNLRAPLPSWLRGLYLCTAGATLASVVICASYYRSHFNAEREMAELTTSNQSLSGELQNLNNILTGQAAARAWGDAVREWATGSTATSSLQAAVLVSVIEAQGVLSKEAAMKAPVKGISAGRSPKLSVQSLSLSVRPDGVVDMVLDLASMGLDSKRIIGALSSGLSTHTPAGFILAGVKPEERTNAGRYFITWKKNSFTQ